MMNRKNIGQLKPIKKSKVESEETFLKVSDVEPNEIKLNKDTDLDTLIKNNDTLGRYNHQCTKKGKSSASSDDQGYEIIQSSFPIEPESECSLVPLENGFSEVCRLAYNKHHNLILDPNQVWISILLQFSLYVRANSEILREKFVDFEGKRCLIVNATGFLFTADYGKIIEEMAKTQITDNIKDRTVVDWLLPDFSTTTPKDIVIASTSIMSTFQEYFEYLAYLKCNLPSVTLKGNLEDWEKLRSKLDRLVEFDNEKKELTMWKELLVPIFDNFVLTKKGQGDPLWWNRIVNNIGGGSGPTFCSGWISCFGVFNKDGKWQGSEKNPDPTKSEWPVINWDRIPSGIVSVPISVTDEKSYHCTLFSGHFFAQASRDRFDLSPRSDWCILVPKSELESQDNVSIEQE